ncbi:MAG: Uma2 family endonuclease [Cyanobacteria bacterium J06639_18]
MILQVNHKLTLQEFLNLPPGEGDITYELVDGQAIPKMSPKFFHAKLTFILCNLIKQWCLDKGEVWSEWSIILTRNGRDWVPTPDLLYVSHQRLPDNWNANEACPVPPELVIEIISPGQTFAQMVSKARDYLDAGVLRVWVVDIEARSIAVFYPDAAPNTYVGDEIITDPLFDGLEFTVEAVFQKAKIPAKDGL